MHIHTSPWRFLLSTVIVLALTATMVLVPDRPALAAEPADGLVVKLVPGADPASIEAEFDITVVDVLLLSRNIWLFDTGDVEEDKVAKDVEKSDDVIYAEPNYRGESPEAGGRMAAWNDGLPVQVADDTDMRTQPAAQALDLDSVHRMATGEGVVVAIADTGLDPAALPHATILPGFDFVDDDLDPMDEPNGLDDDGDGVVDEAFGHGTHVSGIVHLVAPDAAILPIRILDSDGHTTVFMAAEAISTAMHVGADVINLSFGTPLRSDLLKDVLKEAKEAGLSVVSAAGNISSKDKIYPAAEQDVIAVAAVTSVDEVAGFSNRGGWVDVAAPGEHIVSVVPGGGLASWSGTSMAAPFVTGEVALVVQRRPDIDVKKLRKKIRKATRKAVGPDAKDAGGILDIVELFEDLEVAEFAALPGLSIHDRTTIIGQADDDAIDFASEICAANVEEGQAEQVVLARDDDFADALAGTSFPSVSCILFTGSGPATPLDPRASAAIDRALGPDGIVRILGGPQAVSDVVAEELIAAGHQVQRFHGDSRFETAERIAERVMFELSQDGLHPEDVVIGYGYDWPDVVSVGSWVHATGSLILLTDRDSLHPASARVLDRLGLDRTLIVGGPAVVGESVAGAVRNPVRIAGANRVSTAVAVAEQLWGSASHGPQSYVVTNLDRADGWAIALAGAPYAASQIAPQLAVRSESFPAETRRYLEAADLVDVPSITVFGHDSLVGPAVIDAIAQSVAR